jgi:hypothetical protein
MNILKKLGVTFSVLTVIWGLAGALTMLGIDLVNAVIIVLISIIANDQTDKLMGFNE